jgi:hypothetical protein
MPPTEIKRKLAAKTDRLPFVRNGLIEPLHADYSMAHRRLLNPKGKPCTVMHGTPGPDLLTPLLAFDPKKVICIEKMHADVFKITRNLSQWRAESPSYGETLKRNFSYALSERRQSCFWDIANIKGFLPDSLTVELFLLGVDPRRTSFFNPRDGSYELSFPWAYPGEKEKKRTFKYFFDTDVTKPFGYPAALTRLIKGGYQYYYQKSAMDALQFADRYLPNFIANTRNAALISPVITTDSCTLGISLKQYFERGFKFSNEISSSYYKDFAGSRQSDRLKHLYGWHLELWMREQFYRKLQA